MQNMQKNLIYIPFLPPSLPSLFTLLTHCENSLHLSIHLLALVELVNS